MFMIIPGWDVYAELGKDDNRTMASYIKLHVSDDDLEAIVRTLRNNGYTKVNLERSELGGLQTAGLQTVED